MFDKKNIKAETNKNMSELILRLLPLSPPHYKNRSSINWAFYKSFMSYEKHSSIDVIKRAHFYRLLN